MPVRGRSRVARFVRRARGLLALALAALGCAGCRVPGASVRAGTPVPAAGNAELIEYVSAQPLLAAEPAYRAAYILWRGEIFEGEFEGLREALEEGRIVDVHWQHGADEALRRSEAGYLVCRACGIESGLNWRLTGWGRYAWRELQYRRIAGSGSPERYISGGEFVGILNRADRYLREKGRRGRGAELGAEP